MPHMILAVSFESVNAYDACPGYVGIGESTIIDVQVLDGQGNPGIGKTTSVECLAYELLGDSMKDAVLELNASDDR